MSQTFKILMRRVGPGSLLLRTCLLFSSPRSAQDQFDRVWRFGKRLSWPLSARAKIGNFFHAPWENFLLVRAVKLVQADHPDYTPQIKVVGGDLVAAIAGRKQGAIIATIHNHVSASILYVLEQHGIPSSLIARYQPEEFLQVLGAAWPCDVIDVDRGSRHSLVEARQKLKDGRWVVCCADDVDGDQLLMRTGIFEFAARMNTELLFSVVEVSQKGEIEVTFARAPAETGSHTPATDLASRFLQFLEATMSIKKKWTIVRGVRETDPSESAATI